MKRPRRHWSAQLQAALTQPCRREWIETQLSRAQEAWSRQAWQQLAPLRETSPIRSRRDWPICRGNWSIASSASAARIC